MSCPADPRAGSRPALQANGWPDGLADVRVAAPPSSRRSAWAMSAIVAALGFGALHLTRDSPMLRTLTLAVFPFYIAHQTIIVVTGHHLKALHLPVALESALLISITAAGCWLTFDIARRFDLLRPLFGLGPREKKTVAPLDPAPLAQ